MIPTVIFNFNVDSLLEEVTKRSSYFGKMRSTEQEPFLVDRLSLTSGEDFLFSEFLEDAVSETYDWLKAFGRCIPMYDKIVLKYEDTKQYKNYGCYITVQDEKYYDSVYEIKGCSYSSVPNNILLSHPIVGLHNDNNTAMKAEVICETTVYSNINGKQIKDTILSTALYEFNTTVSHTPHTVPFNYQESQVIDQVDVKISVKYTPLNTTPIKKGTYVQYHYNLNTPDLYEVYQVNFDCTNADWMEFSCKLPVDPRGCVWFILERTSHMDNNLIPSIDRNIKEAIVNYILYRWFEYTNAGESAIFLEKFESYAHKAQIGMNSETVIQQRNYKLF